MMAIHVSDPVAVSRLILEDPTWEPPYDLSASEWEKQVKELSWVDNAGRKMVFQPLRDRMVVRESPDGPDLEPFFDNDYKSKDQITRKYGTESGTPQDQYGND
jgi:hypothetical protein